MKITSGTTNQILSLMTVSLNQFIVGISHGWIAPTLKSLQSPQGEFEITPEESSWIASLDDLGEIAGAIFTAFVLDVVGRKILIVSCSLTFFTTWVVISFTRSIPVLCSMRFLLGIFFGIRDGTNSTYLGENSTAKLRGIFGVACLAFYYTGLLFGYVICTYFSYTTACFIIVAMTILALFSIVWIKEPAQFLLMRGNLTKAKENFAWLRGTNVDSEEIQMEFQQIRQNAESENLKISSFKKSISSPANYKSLFIVVIISGLVGCTGSYPVMCYASMAFSATDTLTSNEFTILLGLVQTLVAVSTSLFVGRFNRRSLILISFSLIALSHGVTTALYYVNSNIAKISYFPWLIFASITLFSALFAFVFPVIFIIRGELFPLSIKATGGCLSVIAYAVASFFTIKVFLNISSSYGIETNFFLYSVFALVTVVFVYFFLPESKDKTLVEIQEMLEKIQHS